MNGIHLRVGTTYRRKPETQFPQSPPVLFRSTNDTFWEAASKRTQGWYVKQYQQNIRPLLRQEFPGMYGTGPITGAYVLTLMAACTHLNEEKLKLPAEEGNFVSSLCKAFAALECITKKQELSNSWGYFFGEPRLTELGQRYWKIMLEDPELADIIPSDYRNLETFWKKHELRINYIQSKLREAAEAKSRSEQEKALEKVRTVTFPLYGAGEPEVLCLEVLQMIAEYFKNQEQIKNDKLAKVAEEAISGYPRFLHRLLKPVAHIIAFKKCDKRLEEIHTESRVNAFLRYKQLAEIYPPLASKQELQEDGKSKEPSLLEQALNLLDKAGTIELSRFDFEDTNGNPLHCIHRITQTGKDILAGTLMKKEKT